MAKQFSAESGYSLSLLSKIQDDQLQTDITLCSDGRSASVHSAIISKCSKFLSELLSSNTTKIIFLPGFYSVLFDFVTLVYTGDVENMSAKDAKLLALLCKQLGMETSTVEKETKIRDRAKSLPDSNIVKVEAELFCENTQQKFKLRLPKSRVDLKDRSKKIHHALEGFKGRVQDEYNCSPVGPYEGPYDQHPQIPMYAQLSNSKLDYDKYTNFSHSEESHCKIFKIQQNYGEVDDLNKIETIEIAEDAKDKFVNPGNDEKVFYTCTKKCCMIPCPCHPCNAHEGQCPEHNMKHIDLFDENEHAISVRSTDQTCSKETFFFHSYILKFPGIPKDCPRCKKDLVHHKCYHLNFHWMCKFCKLYQYKLYPKNISELKKRELDEKKWYKSVCPHCDKKFSEPYQVKKHVETMHKNKRLKCLKCTKSFLCKQSLEYHKLTTHTKNVSSHDCEHCEKTFVTKLSLNNHIKFVHTDTKGLGCNKCESKFKHKKYLNAHVLHVHGVDKKKEDYWQDLPKCYYECETCEAKFTRKADLRVHTQFKHIAQSQDMFDCDECPARFKYKKNLQQHKVEKHGPEDNKSKCPDCGKKFNQKRNMERHQLSHRKK